MPPMVEERALRGEAIAISGLAPSLNTSTRGPESNERMRSVTDRMRTFAELLVVISLNAHCRGDVAQWASPSAVTLEDVVEVAFGRPSQIVSRRIIDIHAVNPVEHFPT